METVILLRSVQPSEVDLVTNASHVYASNKDYLKPNFPGQIIETSSESWYFDRAFKIIKQFGHSIYGGKKVAEHLIYGNTSLFYYTRFILINRYTWALKEYLILKDILDQIPKESENGQVLILHNSSYTRLMHSEPNLNFNQYGVEKAGKLNKWAYLPLFLARALFGTLFNARIKNINHLFLFPQVEPQPLLEKDTLKETKGNPITDYYLTDLLKEPGTYVLDERYPVNEGNFSFNTDNLFGRYKGKSVFFEPYLLHGIISPNNKGALKGLGQAEFHLFESIKEEEQNSEIQLLNLIHYDLRNLRKLGARRINAADRLFRKKKVGVLGCIDEYSVKSRSVLNPAMDHGIKTYAIQHGAIHKYHMGYNYLPEDREDNRFVDKLFVYGDAIKDLLISQNHNVGQIIVSGQPRTDVIPNLISKANDIKIEGFKNNKPVILYASQPVSSMGGTEVRDAVNRDFFILSREFPDYHFVLKPHPRETDWNYFYQIAENAGTTNFTITNHDLYLLLSKCSMLLTKSSSVGPEVVNFNKPLVVQDYHNVDIMNYIKDGIGIKATNIDELREVITGLISGKIKHDEDAYSRYRQLWSGPIDGKVCERISELADS